MCSNPRKAARKPREITRHLTIVQPFTNGVAEVRIVETTDGVPDVKDYSVARLVTDFGTGLEWVNPEGMTYHVNLNGEQSTCDCPWGTFKAHLKPCRHVAAGLAMQAAGKLDAPARVEEPAPAAEPITPAAVATTVAQPVCMVCNHNPVASGAWTVCTDCAARRLVA
jgi:SWIM zinc finger